MQSKSSNSSKDFYQNTRPRNFSFAWCFLWLFCFGIFEFLFKANALDYYSSPALSFSYFLVSSLLAITFLSPKDSIHSIPKLTYLKYSLILVLAFFSVSLAIKQLTPIDEVLLEKIIGLKIYFSLFEYKSWFAKAAEILFQQTMILCLLGFYSSRSMSISSSIRNFSFFFCIVHIPILFVMPKVGYLFALPSIMGGIVFSYLILRSSKGFLHSHGLHIIFYFALGVIIRTGLLEI